MELPKSGFDWFRCSQLRLLLGVLHFLVLFTLISSAHSESETGLGYEAPIDLSDSDLKTLETQAIAGEGDAAYQLSQYYGSRQNTSTEQFWSLLAAEDGGGQNQFVYANYLAGNNDTDSQLRAVFWLNVALKTATGDLIEEIKRNLEANEKVMSYSDIACNLRYDPIGRDIHTVGVEKLLITNKKAFNFENVTSRRIMALCGDANAAKALVAYYGFIGNPSQETYFTTIGAEDGDPDAELKAAIILSYQLSDPQAQLRSAFWAKRALANATDSNAIAKIDAFIKRHNIK